MKITSTTEYSHYEATVDSWKTGLIRPLEALKFANMLLDEVEFILSHTKKWRTDDINNTTALKLDKLMEKLYEQR